ncbi:Uncharacterised protein [Campylobacter geochelonis]|uniref:Uncharacterized protein n=1 Tax=Campylobacter geochelonis TaxID=1780362 RepID=A0A128EI14_9BACT|nr:hypothetical protein CGEO_1207 [Campylobacter geochelonis]CZE48446.1 Uncharacterised protein [Campylobacter geochelonis]
MLPLVSLFIIFTIDIIPINLTFNYLCKNKAGIIIYKQAKIDGIYEQFLIDCNIRKIKHMNDLYFESGLKFQEYDTKKTL